MADKGDPLIDQTDEPARSPSSERNCATIPSIERAARAQSVRDPPLDSAEQRRRRHAGALARDRGRCARPRRRRRSTRAIFTLAISVQANTRVAATETKASCPFPAKLQLVPPMDNGSPSIALPMTLRSRT